MFTESHLGLQTADIGKKTRELLFCQRRSLTVRETSVGSHGAKLKESIASIIGQFIASVSSLTNLLKTTQERSHEGRRQAN